MKNCSCNGKSKEPTAPQESSTAFSEPEVRRWPHPVGVAEPAVSSDTALYYIRCALSYQNQLLADIKSQLEKITAFPPSNPTEK
jgi:hypothetical protein